VGESLNIIGTEGKGIVVVRLHGAVEGKAFLDQLEAGLRSTPEPWRYDYVTDMRRYEGITLYSDLEAFSEIWNALAKGRDMGRLSAVITPNPVARARLPQTRNLFPSHIIEVFETFDEGLDWIIGQRDCQHADRHQLA
jgi:hypothetical protein